MDGEGSAATVEFGEFRLDPANECLWRGDQALSLRPKTYALLRHCVDHPGRILTKRELLETVWPDTFVGDSVLKVCVRELRVLLEDDSKRPRFIETVHRRGYRFLADVRPVAAAPVDPPPPPVATSATDPAPLVGRDSVLARMDTALVRAGKGARQLLFVTGDAGLGKTTVVEHFARRAEAAGATVARGQCLEHHGEAEAYLPILDALGALGRGGAAPHLVSVLRRHAPTWLAQLPSLGTDEDRADLERDILGATRPRMLREMAEALEVLTEARPLLLWLEDLHWSDPSTVDLLAAVARRPGPARLAIVGTYRPVDLIVREHRLRPVVRELVGRRLGEELALERLDQAAVEALARGHLGCGDLPVDLAGWVGERTEGNPLFVRELLDAMVGRGHLEVIDGRVRLGAPLAELDPIVAESLRWVIDEQLERHSPEEREVLEVAALAGAEFPALAVAAALDTDEAAVQAICSRLVSQGHLLRAVGSRELPDGSWSERFAFVHDLYRSHCEARVDAATARRHHRRIAERGAQVYGDRADEIAAELAVHFAAAGDRASARRFHAAAAATCARRQAHDEARAHLDRALHLGDGSAAATPADAALLEQRGLIGRAGGDMRGAARDFEAMERAAEAEGDLPCAVRAQLLAASAWSWSNREACLAAVARAEALVADLGDDRLAQHVRASAAYWQLLWTGWPPEGLAALRAAAEDPQLAPAHTVRLSLFLALSGDYDGAARSAARGTRAAIDGGDGFDYLLGLYFHAWALLFAGRWEAFDRVCDEGRGASTRNVNDLWSALFELLAGWRTLATGAAADALEPVRAARGRAADEGVDYGVRLGAAIEALALVQLGRPADALECLDAVQPDAGTRRLMDWILAMPTDAVRARANLDLGRHGDAREAIDRLRANALDSGEPTFASCARVLEDELLRTSDHEANPAGSTAPSTDLVALSELPLSAAYLGTVAGESSD